MTVRKTLPPVPVLPILPLLPLPPEVSLRIRDALLAPLPVEVRNDVAWVNWFDLWEDRGRVNASEVAHVLRQLLELRLVKHVVMEDWFDWAPLEPLQDLWEACPTKCVVDVRLFMEIPLLEDGQDPLLEDGQDPLLEDGQDPLLEDG